MATEVAAAGAGGEPGEVQIISAEFDEEGVFVYQAFNDAIADWALENQRFGGPAFNPERMTWIKPSFAWVLYRSGYGRKHNQSRVLKVKLPHDAFAELLALCQCKDGGGGSKGRVQWDPARDLLAADGKVPRKMLRKRAIQIGLKGSVSAKYVSSVASIQDVTDLAHRIGDVHRMKPGKPATVAAWEELTPLLPTETDYVPRCEPRVLKRLGMLPGATADMVSRIGLGKTASK